LLLTRVLTAAALLAAFAAALFLLERTGFALVVAAIVVAGAFEWARLCKVTGLWAWIYAAVGGGIYWSLVDLRLADSVVAGASIFWLVVAPYWLARGFRPAPEPWRLMVGYVVLVPAGLVMTSLPAKLLTMVLGLVWSADIGAYLVGVVLGRHKLAPSISPGKTWEGVAGGAVFCLAYAIIWTVFDVQLRAQVERVAWAPFLAGILFLCGLSVLGDLFESALKRDTGAKDSGHLLPGHGGVLDRIDSATATLPAALLLLRAMGAA